MSNREMSPGERLAATDPALAVSEEELARSREKSLAVVGTERSQPAVGGPIDAFNRRPRKRSRPVAGFGLVGAVAAIAVGFFVAGSMGFPMPEQATPAISQPATLESGAPLPEITGMRMPTFGNHIVTGSNGHKAAVANDPEADFHMDAANGGKLGLNGAGCIVGTYPDGSEGALIFPAGTQVTGTGVILPDGTTITIGQDFAFGGGLSPTDVDPGECAPRGSAFLVQSWKPGP